MHRFPTLPGRATTEAGYFAIRDNRDRVVHSDFISALKKSRDKYKTDQTFMRMFG